MKVQDLQLSVNLGDLYTSKEKGDELTQNITSIESDILSIESNILSIESDILSIQNEIRELHDPKYKYYSAFELYPNTEAIISGTIDEVTGLEYKVNVPACTKHQFYVYDNIGTTYDKSDIFVDWGDGTSFYLSNLVLDSEIKCLASKPSTWEDGVKCYQIIAGEGEKTEFYFRNDFASSITTDKKRFILKVYGKTYHEIRNHYMNSSGSDEKLVCRAFEDDLPISHSVIRGQTIVNGNLRLLKVETKNEYDLTSLGYHPIYAKSSAHCGNWFGHCKNLQIIKGAYNWKFGPNFKYLNSNFAWCDNLKYCDFIIPDTVEEINGDPFTGSDYLDINIDDVFPKYGFKNSIKGSFFTTCPKCYVSPTGSFLSHVLPTLPEGNGLQLFQNGNVNITKYLDSSNSGIKDKITKEYYNISNLSNGKYVANDLKIKSFETSSVVLYMLPGSSLNIDESIMGTDDIKLGTVKLGAVQSNVVYSLEEINDLLKLMKCSYYIGLKLTKQIVDTESGKYVINVTQNNPYFNCVGTASKDTAYPLLSSFEGFPWTLKSGTSCSFTAGGGSCVI